MKSSSIKLVTVAAALSLWALGLQAQELKIGYVHSDRVLRDAAPAKAAQAKLESEFSKREKDLAELANKLKAAGDKLDKEAPTLSESERNKVIKQIFESEKYDLILQEAVFAGPKVDITDKVIKALNAQGQK
jgi:outer membrane protein